LQEGKPVQCTIPVDSDVNHTGNNNGGGKNNKENNDDEKMKNALSEAIVT